MKAINIILNTLTVLKKITKKSPLGILNNTFKKISPLIELKSMKIGSMRYLVPTALNKSRQLLLGL